MALASALAALCPTPGAAPPGAEGDLLLATRDGPSIACHAPLLRARCTALPDGPAIETGEDAEVVYALLRWVYCERVEGSGRDDEEASPTGLGARAVRLGRRWGLRDVECLQGRVAARRTVTRGSGTLAEDVLRAYDAGRLGGGTAFRAEGSDGAAEVLSSGWGGLLCQRSNYFAAMLGGDWAEARCAEGGRQEITVHWPPEQLARVLRFVHGAGFIKRAEDLRAAVENAKFFGVPALFAHASDWIAANLTLENAPTLWSFVESEPLLRQCDGAAHEDSADADAACFEFHVRHFEDMVKSHPDDELEVFGLGAGRLQELSGELMHRLLAPGLLDVSSDILRRIVVSFAKEKTKGRPMEAYADLCERLRPPAVLFNREHRRSLLPVDAVDIRTFM